MKRTGEWAGRWFELMGRERPNPQTGELIGERGGEAMTFSATSASGEVRSPPSTRGRSAPRPLLPHVFVLVDMLAAIAACPHALAAITKIHRRMRAVGNAAGHAAVEIRLLLNA